MSEEPVFPPVRSRTEEELEAAFAMSRDPRIMPLMPDWRMNHIEQGDEALAEAVKLLRNGGSVDRVERVRAWAAIASAHYQAADLKR